ncbi:hypothetical protein OUZ56_013837 [Daphnia magna]|uniref:Uncharacterized protein n=1 Tax=Daphnia magna TaxID=35525 RepID=A0ABQ9Z731_9CRUS|nr:hypothetical protein OUZ56_013837 [Daphnia magna]
MATTTASSFLSIHGRTETHPSPFVVDERKIFCFVRPSPDAVPGRLIHLLLFVSSQHDSRWTAYTTPTGKEEDKENRRKKEKKRNVSIYTQTHLDSTPPFYTLYSGSNQQFDYR